MSNRKSKISISKIVHKDGRKPYDASDLRLADESIPGVVQREPPPGYKSIQRHINSEKGSKINQQRLESYLERITKKGFVKLPVKDIYSLKPGSRVCYITTDNKWRSGGFVIQVKESSTKYGEEVDSDAEDYDTEYKPYLIYKAFNNAVFSLQVSDIKELWTKPKKTKQKDQRTKFKNLGKETDYAVVLEDDFGNDVVVYYARDNPTRDRFMNTAKFEKALDFGWVFEDGTQGIPLNKSEFNIDLIDTFESESDSEESDDEDLVSKVFE